MVLLVKMVIQIFEFFSRADPILSRKNNRMSKASPSHTCLIEILVYICPEKDMVQVPRMWGCDVLRACVTCTTEKKESNYNTRHRQQRAQNK